MKTKTFRALVALGAPLAVFTAAVLITWLVRVLDQTIAGKILLWIGIIAVLLKIAHKAWSWPGWGDDEA